MTKKAPTDTTEKRKAIMRVTQTGVNNFRSWYFARSGKALNNAWRPMIDGVAVWVPLPGNRLSLRGIAVGAYRPCAATVYL